MINRSDLDRLSNDSKLGAVVTQTIDGTERRLDLTPLVDSYPISVELEARDAGCYVRQGDSTVTLNATITKNFRIQANGWRRITVESASEAYIAVKQSGASTGTLAGGRLDQC